MSDSTLLDKSLIAKIRGIQFRAKYLVTDSFAGEYQSAFKGRGIEFEEVREYQPGDDVRSIDWNVTARSGRPFIKLHRDERELTVMFLVDVSGSSRFGSEKKFKNEISAEISALLAYTALKNNDKVGLLVFSDHVEHFLPPKKGRGHVWQLIRDILTFQSKHSSTNILPALEYIGRILKRRSIIFVISDFIDVDLGTPLATLARRHDVVAVRVFDQREREFPKIGYLNLKDAESGEETIIDSSSESFRQSFQQNLDQMDLNWERFLNLSGIEHMDIPTNETYMDVINRFFRSKHKKR